MSRCSSCRGLGQAMARASDYGEQSVPCAACGGSGVDPSNPTGTDYVCGFAFTPDDRVVLIRKRRPFWQAGLLNGVGGRIETGEGVRDAMAREFHEEAGVVVPYGDWCVFHRETWRPSGNSVHFLVTRLPDGLRLRTATDESIHLVNWKHWSSHSYRAAGLMYNLCYLVPMASCLLDADPADFPFHKENH